MSIQETQLEKWLTATAEIYIRIIRGAAAFKSKGHNHHPAERVKTYRVPYGSRETLRAVLVCLYPSSPKPFAHSGPQEDVRCRYGDLQLCHERTASNAGSAAIVWVKCVRVRVSASLQLPIPSFAVQKQRRMVTGIRTYPTLGIPGMGP